MERKKNKRNYEKGRKKRRGGRRGGEGGREGRLATLEPSSSIVLKGHAVKLTQTGFSGVGSKTDHIYTELIQLQRANSEPQDKNSLENQNLKSIHNLKCS